MFLYSLSIANYSIYLSIAIYDSIYAYNEIKQRLNVSMPIMVIFVLTKIFFLLFLILSQDTGSLRLVTCMVVINLRALKFG